MAKKRTKLKVRNGEGPGAGSDIHEMPPDTTPGKLADQVNNAIKARDRLVTFRIDDNKALSVIAENVEAIWQE